MKLLVLNIHVGSECVMASHLKSNEYLKPDLTFISWQACLGVLLTTSIEEGPRNRRLKMGSRYNFPTGKSQLAATHHCAPNDKTLNTTNMIFGTWNVKTILGIDNTDRLERHTAVGTG